MVEATFRYWGISPWEIEVLYGYFSSRFEVIQEETEPSNAEFASYLSIHIPVAFGDQFFEWFNYRRWEKVKDLLKEIKRRRGSGNAIRVDVTFQGNRSILFRIESEEKRWFDNSIEKLDFVLELLPYHTEKLPPATHTIQYMFDERTVRWRLHTAHTANHTYRFRGDGWSRMEDDP